MSVYGELSSYPMYINRYVRVVKYWCIIIDSNNIIVNKLYSILLDDMTRGKCNWPLSVKQLLLMHVSHMCGTTPVANFCHIDSSI